MHDDSKGEVRKVLQNLKRTWQSEQFLFKWPQFMQISLLKHKLTEITFIVKSQFKIVQSRTKTIENIQVHDEYINKTFQ